MEVTIEEVTPADKEAIIDLGEKTNEAQVIPHLNEEGKMTMRTARKKDIASALDKSIYQCLKAQISSKIVGYVAWREGHYIAQLYVMPEYQGLGIGKRLLTEVSLRVETSHIRLRASVNAVGFYAKYGFVATDHEQSIKGIRFVPMEFAISV